MFSAWRGRVTVAVIVLGGVVVALLLSQAPCEALPGDAPPATPGDKPKPTAKVLFQPTGSETVPEFKVDVQSSEKGQFFKGKEPGTGKGSEQNPEVCSGKTDEGPKIHKYKPEGVPEITQLSNGKLKVTNPEDIFEAAAPPIAWEKVAHPAAYPYCVHGHMLMTFPKGTFIGSGTLIGPRHVLTAGHCVYDASMGGFATDVLFNPGQNGDDISKYGSFHAKALLTTPGWREASDASPDDPDHSSDLGMLILPSDVGEKTGWFGVGTFVDAELQNIRVNVVGYPFIPGVDKSLGKEMYASHAVIRTVSKDRLTYDAQTSGGEGGAAIWGVWPCQEGYTVVGVHTLSGQEGKMGTRISKSKFDAIKEWLTSN